MKRLFILLMISSFVYPQNKSLPALYASSMTNDGSHIYLFGGLIDEPSGIINKACLSSLVNDLFKYMPDENVWEEESPSDNVKPEGRYFNTLGNNLSSNSIYLFGGYTDNQLLTDIWIFNLASKKWNKVNQQSTISERMKYGIVHTTNGFNVIGGTTISDQPIKENWHYNINTNTWTRKNDVPFSNTHINAATKVSSDKIFVFKKQGQDKFYIYNEVTDTWREQTTTGTIPDERYNGICVANGQKVFVGGGYTVADGKLKDFYELDTDNWIWKKLTDLPKELDGAASTAMNNKIYVYGGLDKSTNKSNKFYEYNVTTNTWSEKNTLVGIEKGEQIPIEFILYQNYPNPFNPETVISYQLSVNSWVTLKVYDLLGREVKTLVNEYKQTGKYSLEFRVQNSDIPSGIYFYRLTNGNFSETKKMLLLK